MRGSSRNNGDLLYALASYSANGFVEKPTKAELAEAIKSGDTFKNVTPEEIIREYDEGREASISFCSETIVVNLSEFLQAINVWTMKCVGYDEAFQRELCAKYPLWVSGVKHEDDVKIEDDLKDVKVRRGRKGSKRT